MHRLLTPASSPSIVPTPWCLLGGQVPLHSNGTFDLDTIDERVSSDQSIRVLHIQRSCGYQWRPSIPIAEIGRAIAHIRSTWAQKDPQRELIIFVDNCYGELVEDREPTHVGADLVAGSLIKVWYGHCHAWDVNRGWREGRGWLVSPPSNQVMIPTSSDCFGMSRTREGLWHQLVATSSASATTSRPLSND